MRHGFRFQPPNIPAPQGVFWTLQRAFGPLTAPAVPSEGLSERLRVAQRLGLLPRICARHPLPLLARELGSEAAESLSQRTRVQMAQGLAIEATRRQILTVAQGEETPLVLLKFAALHAKGRVTVASRAACDLDVLLSPANVPRLATVLIAQGYQKPDLHSPPHQPIVLKSPMGAAIELHVHLPYLRTSESGPFAGFESLRDAQLLEPYPPDNAFAFLPKDELLIAHLIAHGLAQHGFEPKTYPLWRMVADLFDLDFAATDFCASTAFSWLSTDVSVAEVNGLSHLLTVLSDGGAETLWPEDSGAARLLRHFVLAPLDEKYQARVLLRRVKQSVEEEGVWKVLQHLTEFGFLLSDDHLDKIYRNDEGSRAWRRLKRPFDFVRRGVSRVWKASRR